MAAPEADVDGLQLQGEGSQVTIRILLSCLALIVASCSDEPRFRASTSRVEVHGVLLAIEPCEPNRPGCDFEFELTNNSVRCVAFLDIRLPSESFVFFESSLPTRIRAQPSERARYTWVVLQPDASFGDIVDVQALTGLRDLSELSMTVSTEFIPCTSFVQLRSGAQPEVVEGGKLESETITFSRVS